MTARPPAPKPSQLPEFAQELDGRMGHVRRWRTAVIFATAGALALALVLASLLAACLLDFLLVLPQWVRALWLLASLGGAGWLVWKRGVCVQRQQPDDETVALMIERGLPAFRSRFISAVQLARSKPTPLIRALIAETVAFSRTQRLSAAIDKRALWRALAAAIGAVLVVSALAFASGGYGAPLLRRALLGTESAPRATRLQMLSGSRAIGLGDDFTVEAGVSGVVPAAGRLYLKPATGHPLDLPLEAEAAHPTHFTRTLASVQEPFDYFVTLGDARSETFHVKVLPRPVIVSVEATEKFPSYAGVPPRPVTLDNLKLLAGSRLALRVKAGALARSGVMRLLAGERTLAESPLVPDAKDATQLAGEIAIPARDATGLNLRITDADGLESPAATVYRIEIAGDQPPVVQISQPAYRTESLAPGGTMLLGVEARDDSGLAKIRFHYAVDWVEGAPSSLVEIDLAGDRPRQAARSFDWKVTKIRPPVNEGQVIDYWFEALDTRESAGSGVTEHFQVRVVSEFEKRGDIAGRLGETAKGLERLQRDEEAAATKLASVIGNIPADPPSLDLLRERENKQKQLAGDVQKLVAQLAATLAEYERNRLTGADVDAVKKMHATLSGLSANAMPATVELLQKARAAGDPDATQKALSEAVSAQKQILAQIAPLLAEHGRQRGGFELSHALAQLADRQAANLQKAIEAGKRVVTKKTESLATAIIRETLDEQATEQVALAADLKSVTEKIAQFAREPGHAEVTQRFQAVATEAQRLQPIVDAAVALLKQGQLYKAGTEEKTAHDALHRIARLIAPPLSPAESLHIAERDLGRMIAEETAIATEAQSSATPETLPAIEIRQGRLAGRSDLLAQDLATQAPAAMQALRAAFEKMQDVRAMLLDKSPYDAAQQAQAALANLEKARAEITTLAGRAASPAQPSATPGAPPAGQQLAAAEKRARELAGIIEDVQQLELETAKAIAQAPSKINDQLKGLGVRQADLRAQTGDAKTALAGDPAEAVDALDDAARDMGAARSQLDSGDGPGADATQRKVLANLYRAQRALSRKIAQLGEQAAGSEVAQANAMTQTSAQLAQAQAALAESQHGFQKYEAARQAGQANARILQDTAAALARAAQQAGRAAAGSRTTSETARRAMQDATQDAADATAQAAAGRVPAAQEKAATAQARLTLAIHALALEQAGLAAMDTPTATASQSGSLGASKPGALDFTTLPPRDRAAIEQSRAEKYPAEYQAQFEQYLRNLTGENPGK